MRHRVLQDLIGRAIVDKDFREQLLNGRRQQTIAEFDLTDDEKMAIDAIEARNFEEFAGKLHRWLEGLSDMP